MTAASLGAVDLLPCPFCGRGEFVRVIAESGQFAVACDARGDWSSKDRGCGSACGFHDTEDAARKAWNDRSAALTPAAGGDDELLDAAEAMLRWLVKNVDLWHFPQYDDLHRACTNRRAAPAPPPAATDAAVLAAFRAAGMVIESGATYSVRGQIAQLLNGAAALSAPPPADAVRALVGKWRGYEASYRAIGKAQAATVSAAFIEELEEALSAAPAIEDTHGNAVKINGEWMDYRDAAAPTPKGCDHAGAVRLNDAYAVGCPKCGATAQEGDR